MFLVLSTVSFRSLSLFTMPASVDVYIHTHTHCFTFVPSFFIVKNLSYDPLEACVSSTLISLQVTGCYWNCLLWWYLLMQAGVNHFLGKLHNCATCRTTVLLLTLNAMVLLSLHPSDINFNHPAEPVLYMGALSNINASAAAVRHCGGFVHYGGFPKLYCRKCKRY